MLANGKHHPIVRLISAAENRQLAKTVALARTEHGARRNQLVNDGNHQPIVRNSGLAYLGAKLVTTLCDSL